MSLHAGREFDCNVLPTWRAVGNRSYRYDRVAAGSFHGYNDTRTGVCTLVVACIVFMSPKVLKLDDATGFGRRQRHLKLDCRA